MASPSSGLAIRLLLSILIPHRRKPRKTAKSNSVLVSFLLMEKNLYVDQKDSDGKFVPVILWGYYSTNAQTNGMSFLWGSCLAPILCRTSTLCEALTLYYT